jgi:hypothetical protein
MCEYIRHPQLIKLTKDVNEKYITLLKYAVKKDISNTNPKINITPDCGFFSKRYGEFNLTYATWSMNYPLAESFKIDNINVEISEPSNLYKLIFDKLTYDKNFSTWETFYTIKIKNCSKDELEGILQQVLYIIAKYLPPEIEGDYPEIIPFQFEDDRWLWDDEDEQVMPHAFSKTNNHEPLAFYNHARKSNDPLYYYKVLEYFFIINKKSEIQKLVTDYNKDSKIDKLMDSITKIYVSKEDRLLENLLTNINGIDKVIKQAYEDEILQVEDLKTFSNKLYEYRNSIVHGKKDAKFELTVPTILNQDTNDNRWRGIIRTLAEKVITQFCLSS